MNSRVQFQQIFKISVEVTEFGKQSSERARWEPRKLGVCWGLRAGGGGLRGGAGRLRVPGSRPY